MSWSWLRFRGADCGFSGNAAQSVYVERDEYGSSARYMRIDSQVVEAKHLAVMPLNLGPSASEMRRTGPYFGVCRVEQWLAG